MNSKNILYVVTRLPWPLIGGDRVHIYHYLKELKKRGYNITLVTLVRDDDDLEGAMEHNEFYTKLIPVRYNKKLAYLGTIQAIFNENPFIVQYYYKRKMQKVIDKEIKTGNYDVVIGYMIRSVPYLKKIKNIKKILHICDCYTLLYKRRIEFEKSLFGKFKIFIEYLKVKNYEKIACQTTDKQIMISNSDNEYLLKHVADVNTTQVINWATDTEFFTPQNAELKNNICMVGSMQYIPNFEAAKYFAKEVFPLIKKQIPDAKFKIIGANPQAELYEIAKKTEGIIVTGRVDDVREYMKDCKVSVCPTRVVSGFQTKLLEAMSMGIPIVTTKESAAGVEAPNDILLIANSNEDYANKVIELMNNKNLHDKISIDSRQFILNNFVWDKIGEVWDKMISEVCK